MIALQVAGDRVDVEDAGFSELFFEAEKRSSREFDTDFVFRVDVRFEVGTGKVPDLAHVRGNRVFRKVVAADEGFVFGGVRRQRDQEGGNCREYKA